MQVDIYSHVTLTSNTDFYKINPKGNVPTLVLDDGTVINEGLAVLQYLADQVSSPGRCRAGKAGKGMRGRGSPQGMDFS